MGQMVAEINEQRSQQESRNTNVLAIDGTDVEETSLQPEATLPLGQHIACSQTHTSG